MNKEQFSGLFESEKLIKIAEKVFSDEAISTEDALFLYQEADLDYLSLLSRHTRQKLNRNRVYFNKNVHIEPTNICIHSCKFCSYRRRINEDGAWEYSIEEILNQLRPYKNSDITEVHIVGGVHPHRDIDYYAFLLKTIKDFLPGIHLKAFTAVEIDQMVKKSRIPIEDGLKKLQDAGLGSMPGGGAEIFDESLRKKICPDKTGSQRWLDIHETAHNLGIPTNCTILYGHYEQYEQRVDHLNRLRMLQSKTGGFNTFIPLKFKHQNNEMSDIGEVSLLEDLRNYAVSRIFLHNIPHIKAYWPMIGKETTQLALSYGVDDIDGTIDDSTQIYSMAGAEDQHPSMTSREIIQMIKEAKRIPVERDTLYHPIKTY